jgi:beta-galactosidase/beta-glucuronidase
LGPQAASIFYARTTGIWQTVWLEPVSPSHLESIRITPSVDGIVSVSAKISVPGQAQFVTMSISDDTRALASAMSLADGPGAALSAQIPEPKLWSPDQPHLYILHSNCTGRPVCSIRGSYFGGAR